MAAGRENGNSAGGDGIRIVASAVVLALVAALAAMVAFEPFAKDESSGATGPAAIDFGSNLSATPSQGLSCAGSSCTLWNGALAAGSTAGTVAAPIDGVIVSFTLRTKQGFGWAPVRLRVVRANGQQWGGLGASTPDVTPSDEAGQQTFDVRLPIEAGDYVGLETDDGVKGIYADASPVTGSTIQIEQPKLPAGGAPQDVGFIATSELLLRARVEPDSDADGYGDVTQDDCPADPAAQREPCAITATETTTGPATTAPTNAPATTTAAQGRRCPKGKKLKRGKCVKAKRKKPRR